MNTSMSNCLPQFMKAEQRKVIKEKKKLSHSMIYLKSWMEQENIKKIKKLIEANKLQLMIQPNSPRNIPYKGIKKG